MRRQNEYLDQRLGDFAPSQYSANAIQLERLLDRYGLIFIRDYPQILFENREQWRLPGWQYRGQPQEYTVLKSVPSPAHHGQSQSEHAQAPVAIGVKGQADSLTRLAAAYRVLDDMFAPSPEPSRQKPYFHRQGYAGAPRRGYRSGFQA
ncbi:MAG TPA: hypothetical protein PKY77_15065 [Phycisphaerae bacterium]|nr:hypothetical protein [Phycisphaerae bacterium]HRY70436.1 hypothetical protein [Phycisphaerae bacterium]HSA27670.1 hypothetical protein [Phycisphaerae bacterium]